MLVIVVSNVPPAVRGRLSLWLLEVRAGVYVGQLSRRNREQVWKTVTDNLGEGDAVMVTPDAKSEGGFAVRTAGENRRRPEDWEGLTLIAFDPLEETAETAPKIGGFSDHQKIK
jgi:CRISPR-associated protein Cas2